MSPAQLLTWAQAPWDFWYPPTAFDTMLSMLRGSSQGYSVTASILAAIEAGASLMASMAAAEESNVSLRPVLFSPVEPSASLASNTLAPHEFAGAAGSTTAAPENSAASFFARASAILEPASGARVTARAPIDFQAALKSLAGAPIAFAAAAKSSLLDPADFGVSLRGSIAVPTTSSALFALTDRIVVEWAGTAASVIATIGSPIEIGHGVAARIFAPLEWWGSLANWAPFVFTYAGGAFPLGAAGVFIGDWIGDFLGAEILALRASFTSGVGGNFIKIYFQTSLDKGATAIDVAPMKFTRASAAAGANVSAARSAALFTPSSQALTPGALAGAVLGDRFRAVVVVFGAYAAPASLSLTGFVR
jgi:hypothetical protein